MNTLIGYTFPLLLHCDRLYLLIYFHFFHFMKYCISSYIVILSPLVWIIFVHTLPHLLYNGRLSHILAFLPYYDWLYILIHCHSFSTVTDCTYITVSLHETPPHTLQFLPHGDGLNDLMNIWFLLKLLFSIICHGMKQSGWHTVQHEVIVEILFTCNQSISFASFHFVKPLNCGMRVKLEMICIRTFNTILLQNWLKCRKNLMIVSILSINRSVVLIKMKDKAIETVQETKIHMPALDFTCWTRRGQ